MKSGRQTDSFSFRRSVSCSSTHFSGDEQLLFSILDRCPFTLTEDQILFGWSSKTTWQEKRRNPKQLIIVWLCFICHHTAACAPQGEGRGDLCLPELCVGLATEGSGCPPAALPQGFHSSAGVTRHCKEQQCCTRKLLPAASSTLPWRVELDSSLLRQLPPPVRGRRLRTRVPGPIALEAGRPLRQGGGSRCCG